MSSTGICPFSAWRSAEINSPCGLAFGVAPKRRGAPSPSACSASHETLRPAFAVKHPEPAPDPQQPWQLLLHVPTHPSKRTWACWHAVPLHAGSRLLLPHDWHLLQLSQRAVAALHEFGQPGVERGRRAVVEEIEVMGHRFQRGDQVGLLLAAANRDPGVWEDPAAFRPTRLVKPNATFGAGLHFISELRSRAASTEPA